MEAQRAEQALLRLKERPEHRAAVEEATEEGEQILEDVLESIPVDDGMGNIPGEDIV